MFSLFYYKYENRLRTQFAPTLDGVVDKKGRGVQPALLCMVMLAAASVIRKPSLVGA